MITILKMAFRDLGRNRRRSFFSALALAIGVALLLLISATINGEMKGSMESTIKLQSGHLQVQAKNYDENKTSLAYEDLITDPENLAEQIAGLAPVKLATPRLYASGIVDTPTDSVGVRIVGIDPESEANAPFRDGLVSGAFITADDREGVMVGKSLADKLGLAAGDSINLLVNTSNGEVDQQSFLIRGLFNTHFPSFDQGMVYMPLAKAQSITRTDGYASTIFILLQDREQTSAVVNALQTNQYKVLTYVDMNKLLSETEQLTQGYMALIYMIVLAMTAAVIVNTLLMAVFERTREIGILSAIGMKGGNIMAMFFAESFFLAVGGIVMGLILGLGLVAYATNVGFYIGNYSVTGFLFGETIYASLNPSDAVSLTITAFVITLLAALYPAAMAARMEPVDAMRGGKQA
jgi:ABC-type lipoprotein release transport system permease subunit